MTHRPLSIGQRDRVHQYDKYVKPTSAEKKILMTQKYHKRCQKKISKALDNIKEAIDEYNNAWDGNPKVVPKLADMMKNLRVLKEDIMKLTYNNLPYAELDKERIDENEVMGKYFQLSKFQKIIIFTSIGDCFVYLLGSLYQNSYIIGLGIFGMFGIILALYYRWISSHRPKTVSGVKKIEGAKEFF
ncbi:MAG: hypothetical protein JXA91_01405 [Candidatus Thermoplasmatota archaeon]|nr:hypothetical protein [Candidatus Thermoplasmatota archaeon]